MKSKFLTAIAAIGISTIGTGCAHYHKIEGREERSEIPEGVRVNIGSSEVKAAATIRQKQESGLFAKKTSFKSTF